MPTTEPRREQRRGDNPSSAYKFSSKLKSVVEMVRVQVAELIEAQPHDVKKGSDHSLARFR
jgi:cysteine sulfinate desulfinase/cysteine desulfurase-like protein